MYEGSKYVAWYCPLPFPPPPTSSGEGTACCHALFPRLLWQGANAVCMQFSLWKSWGGDGVWEEEIFPKGRKRLPCTRLLPQHNVWHIVGAQQMLAKYRKKWKEEEALLLELKLRKRAVQIWLLCPRVLTARVWPPKSEFVKNCGLLRSWRPCC